MPGVNLDLLPASEAPEALGSPDSACAESGLEEAIGDLLAQEEAEHEEELFCKREFEVTLQCAVGEIHSDLQAFGKRVDVCLKEAASQVAPLAEALARLQEENLRMSIQQEKLLRQVEALCKVMGLPDSVLHELASKESSPTIQCESEIPSSDSLSSSNDAPAGTSQDEALEAPHETSSHTLEDSLSSAPQDSQAGTLLHSPSSISQEASSCPKESDSVSAETSTPPTPETLSLQHPPTFATCRSLSAPSGLESISCSKSAVQLSDTGLEKNPNALFCIQISCVKNGNVFLFLCSQYMWISWPRVLPSAMLVLAHVLSDLFIGFNSLTICP